MLLNSFDDFGMEWIEHLLVNFDVWVSKNMTTKGGKITPFQLAFGLGYIDIVKLMLKCDPSLIINTNKSFDRAFWKTPSYVRVFGSTWKELNGNPQMLKLLEDTIANKTTKDNTKEDNDDEKKTDTKSNNNSSTTATTTDSKTNGVLSVVVDNGNNGRVRPGSEIDGIGLAYTVQTMLANAVNENNPTLFDIVLEEWNNYNQGIKYPIKTIDIYSFSHRNLLNLIDDNFGNGQNERDLAIWIGVFEKWFNHDSTPHSRFEIPLRSVMRTRIVKQDYSLAYKLGSIHISKHLSTAELPGFWYVLQLYIQFKLFFVLLVT